MNQTTRSLTSVCHFDRDDVVTLTSSANVAHKVSTREAIFSSFAKFKQGARYSLFVFYFSGHGLRLNGLTDYIIPKACPLDSVHQSAITLEALLGEMNGINADEIFVAFDACRSDFSLAHARTFSFFGATPIASNKYSIFTASRAGCVSWEWDAIQSGLFSYALSKAIQEDPRCRRLDEVAAATRSITMKLSQMIGHSQEPQFSFYSDDARRTLLPVAKCANQVSFPTWLKFDLPSWSLNEHTVFEPKFQDSLINIDFGTSKTAASLPGRDPVCFVTFADGAVLVPSCVTFFEDGRFRVGERSSSGRIIENGKRLIVDARTERVFHHDVNPETIALICINYVRENYIKQFGFRPKFCNLSVPSDFNLPQIESITSCAISLNMFIRNIVIEPIACAFNILSFVDLKADQVFGETVHFELGDDSGFHLETFFLVVDLGGGTLDVAFCRCESLVNWGLSKDLYKSHSIDVLATSGHNRIGGLDVDTAITNYIINKVISESVVPLGDLAIEAIRGRLSDQVEDLKLYILSSGKPKFLEFHNIYGTDGERIPIRVKVVPKEVRRACHSIYEQVRALVDACVDQVNLWDEDAGTKVEAVIIGGEAGLDPSICDMLSKRFSEAAILNEYADCAVARGMALMSSHSVTFSNINYLSVGFEYAVSVGKVYALPTTESERALHGACKVKYLLWPDQAVPASGTANVSWRGQCEPLFRLFTRTIGRDAVLCREIVLDVDHLQGDDGIIEIRVDKNLTYVVRIRDHFGGELAWQLNNHFFRVEGYDSVGQDTNHLSARRIARHPSTSAPAFPMS